MRRIVLLVAMVAAWVAGALAQPRTVTGVVTSSEDGSPLPQLSIALKGTPSGVVTDLEGHYRITVPGPEAVLQFVYMGMETQEITVGDRTEINVVMQPIDKAIDQVVVVGYGTGKKISSTVGKVSSVGAQKLEAKPAANAMDALAGQVPGMSVLTQSGEPSSLSSIRLHGSGSTPFGAGDSPLYVIDGLPVSQGTIQGLNPADFERVDVLTDASATSIYGARAANGVIYITTKQGKAADDGKVTARYSFGLSILANTDYFKNFQNTEEALAMFRELETLQPGKIQEIIDTYGTRTYRWYRYYYQANAPMHNADVSFQGGSKKYGYFISAGYYNAKGLRPLSSYERYNLRANVNGKLKKWLRLGLNVGLSYDRVRSNPDANGQMGGGIMRTPSWLSPTEVDPKTGRFVGTSIIPTEFRESHYFNIQHTCGLTSTGFIQIQPIEGLTIKSQGGIEGAYFMNPIRDLPSIVNKGRGTTSETASAIVRLINSNTVEYNFTVGEDHNFTPLLGQEYTYGFSKSFRVESGGMTDARLMLLQRGRADQTTRRSSWSEYWFMSYFGRLEYAYTNRYFFDASLRNDASSRFGKKNRNAFFWSVGAMWRAKNETFLSEVKWLDELTVKASVGTSGNAAIGDYTSVAQVSGQGTYNGVKGLAVDFPGNPDLGWEKQLKFSAGFTLGLFDRGRLDFGFYRRNTYDLIMDVPRPLTTGFSSVEANVGQISNTGVDVRLDVDIWKDRRGNHVTPYINFNYNRQRVERLFQGRKAWTQSAYLFGYRIGHPVELLLPKFYRIDPADGKPEWYMADPDDPTNPRMDPNYTTKDPAVAESQLQSLGKSYMAPVQGGFGLNAELWGAYIQADFVYQLGKYLINNDRYFNENPVKFPGINQSKRLDLSKYWKQPGDKDMLYPNKREEYWMFFDDRLLENASFMRLKNLTIGYNFPKKWMERTKFFSTARVYATMRNLITVTKYSGPDPEIDTSLTYAMNPNTRQFLLGIEFTF